MKEKQAKFIEKMQLSKPRLYWRLIETNRKLYNDLCRTCQVKTVNMRGNIKPENYCDNCREKAQARLKTIKEIIEKAGGKVK